jgi:hypothetical protein
MNLTIDLNTVITSVVGFLVIALFKLIFNQNKTLYKIVDQIGSNHPPEGIMGRLSIMELELSTIREWAIRNGFDRRIKDIS